MHALSLKQPWAELVLTKRKTIETRKWNTKFRGEFFIHASKNVDFEACAHFGFDPSSFVTGAIVGKAKLVSTKEYATKEEFEKDDPGHAAGFLVFSRPRFGFVLSDIERVESVPCKGALGFFQTTV